MKKLFFTALILFSLTDLTAQVPYSNEVKAQIKQVENNLAGRLVIDGHPYNIQDRMAFYHVKGLSMAVIHDYKTAWAKGYGWADEKQKRRVTNQTLFKPGSISKSLNAVGILKLVQDNILDLNVDINAYLKSWKFPYDSTSKGKKITLAQLLSHTAGLSVYGGFPGYDAKNQIPTVPQILDGTPPANTPPVRSLFEPGIAFQYSGGGTIISQLIITDVTHQSYEQYMYDHVLKPIGMGHSFYRSAPPGKDKLGVLATGYTKDGTAVEATYHVYPEQAPLGLWTTPTDLSNYIIETQLALNGKSSKVLNRKMAQLHVTPYIDPSAALGTFVQERNGVKYFFHDAGNEGYRGLYFGSMEDGNGVVIFVNSDSGDIILELLNSVASVYHWKGFDKPIQINTTKVPESLAVKYSGVYLYDGKIAEVIKKQDGLYYWTEGQDVKMYFTSDKDFVNMEFPSEKSFLTDSSGNVTGYSRMVNGKEFPNATKITRIDTLRAGPGQINTFGWHLLETKRFDDAIAYLKRGIELEPEDLSAKLNLAHCYLFTNQYDLAVKLYNEYLGQKPDEKATSKATIKQDFDFFRKNGFDKILLDKATITLKL